MFFLAFPCVTPEGFNFLDGWCLVYSDRFLTQLSVELFGIFFENLVLPVDIIPPYKPAYYLCFCLDFLPGGVLDIFLGGEVRRGPSCPDPV